MPSPSVPRALAAAALILAAAFPARAQLVTYSFTGATGSEITFAPDAPPTGATASDFRRGSGLTPSNAANAFSSSGFSTAARDTADHYAFTLAPTAGPLRLDSLVFAEQRSGTGPRAWAVFSSLDGYAAPLDTLELPDVTTARRHRVALPAAFASVAGPVTFRLYGYAAEAAAGTWRINDLTVFGAAGAGPATTTIQFGQGGARSVAEGAGTGYYVQVRLLNPSATEATSVTLAVTGGTATAGADYAAFAARTLTFAPGDTTSQFVNPAILQDTQAEGSETVVFALSNPSRGALGSPSIFTLTILDDDTATPPPVGVRTIAAARAAGPDSTVTVAGTVTRARGAFARIQDRTAGLTLRATAGAFFDAVASGEVTTGDSLVVTGRLSAFNGLLQINAADLTSFTRVARGRSVAAQTVTLAALAANGEQYESELVRVVDLTTASTGTFAPATTYPVTDATGTLDLRTPNAADTDVDGLPLPTGAFTFEGVLGQFSTTTGGYQLLPVLAADVTSTGPPPPTTVAFASASGDAAEGTTATLTVALRAPDATAPTTAEVYVTGGTATAGVDYTFTPTTVTFPAGSSAAQTVSVQVLTDADADGGETVTFGLRNVAGGNAASAGTPAAFTLTLREGGGGGTVCPNLLADALLTCLRQTYARTTAVGYDQARDFLYNDFYPDADPATPGKQFRGVYTGRTGPRGGGGSTTEIDTEHTWPRSQMPNSGAQEGDMHNLYPTISKVNNDRGNLPFGEIDDPATDGWYGPAGSLPAPMPTANIDAYSELDSGLRFEPREDHAGNVARAVAYFYTMYGTASQGFWEAMWPYLQGWNLQDPADTDEKTRNAFIRTKQGNLNPFIEDATLLERAFGTPVLTAGPFAPAAFGISDTWPNPTRGGLTVRYGLPETAAVTAEVFDALGRRVYTTSASAAAGADRRLDLDAAALPAGVYVVRLRAATGTGVREATARFVRLP